MSLLHYKNITLSKVLESNDFPRKTKIVCTIGPACDNVDTLVAMIDAGMNVARLNFSHGDHESKRETIRNIREAVKLRPDSSVAILLDTKGPEIRTGFLEDPSGMHLRRGDHVEIVTDYEFKGAGKVFACSYDKLPQSVKVGNVILAADGSLVMKVVKILETSVVVEMQNSGKLGERKNMNLPGNKVDLPTITEKDKIDLRAFAKDVDFVAASFVQKASDMELVRDALGPEGKAVQVIAKIENQEGLQNFEEILETFDGIMVARGDMGMEIPIEKVFLAQKMLIRRCNLVGKPVITATQMLESMTQNPRPTRAETTDVANAVLDGTDGVMLSGETAGGAYPLESVNMIASVCREAEAVVNHGKLFSALENSIKAEIVPHELNDSGSVDTDKSGRETSISNKSRTGRTKINISETIISGAVKMQVESDASLIVVVGDDGTATKALAKYRPSSVVIFVTENEKLARQMSGLWNAIYCVISKESNQEACIEKAYEHAKTRKWVRSGDNVVLLKKSKSGKFSVNAEQI